MTNVRRRSATADDVSALVDLWGLLFPEDQHSAVWREEAVSWLVRSVEEREVIHLPVIESDGRVIASVVGTVEQGVPNPFSPTGKSVRLANLITVPEHRGHGHGTSLVRDVIAWARAVRADRIDLGATPEGQGLYRAEGFVNTTAPRMKLML